MSLCPICHNEIGTWTDDPIKTPNGLAGEDYKGITKINWHHIKEIQDARKLQEIEFEISDKTTFSEISPTIPPHKNHILELRQSTEKLIENVGSNLIHYFNYKTEEHEEIYVGTYKYGEKVADKTNWTDPGLIDVKIIKAIHIEELRHPILSVLYNMEGHLIVLPTSIEVNRACNSFPYSTRIRAYWGLWEEDPQKIEVTEKATYTVMSGDIVISGAGYIQANTAGSVRVSFVPPGFEEYTREQCSFYEEEEEIQCVDNYMTNTYKIISINSYYHLSYSGELQGGGLLEYWPSHSGGLYGSGSPLECGSLTFSWDDQTYLTYGINAHWKCDTTSRAYLTRYTYYRAGGLSFTPVSSFPYGSPCPNPNGFTSGEFEERLSAYKPSSEVCFEGEEGYWFSFGWSRTTLGDWYYEAVDLDDDEIFDVWQLRVNRNEVVTEGLHKSYWWASFHQYF